MEVPSQDDPDMFYESVYEPLDCTWCEGRIDGGSAIRDRHNRPYCSIQCRVDADATRRAVNIGTTPYETLKEARN